MNGKIGTLTRMARDLLNGLADGDYRLVHNGDAWLYQAHDASACEQRDADNDLVSALLARGFLEAAGTTAVLTERGRRFAAGHGSKVPLAAPGMTSRGKRSRSAKPKQIESPLEWLHSRKGSDGKPLIGDAAFKAGERLQAEFMRAGLMPRMTADLTAIAPGKRGKASARGPAPVLDATLDARDRVNQALSAVGADMAGLLVDVCCHLKSLGAVERERGWPKRSAKVVLDLGLARLACHYGLQEEAEGPGWSRKVRHWGGEGYRPAIDG